MNKYDKCGMCIQWNTIQPQKKKEILIYATTWMNLEDIMNEISLSQKDKYGIISLEWSNHGDRK